MFLNSGKWPNGEQIPKDSSVLKANGSINWDKEPEGGYVLDANGNAIKEQFVPEIGEIIDRYGSPSGRYTSPVLNGEPFSYTERSLPYVQDMSNYHQYEVIGDFSRIEEYINNCADAKLREQIDAMVQTYYNGDYGKLISLRDKLQKLTVGESAAEFNMNFR